MKRLLLILLSAALISLFFYGCSGKDKTVDSEEPTANTQEGEIKDPAEPTKESAIINTGSAESFSGHKIYFLVSSIGDPYWLKVQQGADAAAKENDVDLVISGVPSVKDTEKQIEQIQNAIAAGADAIVIAPADRYALATPVAEAYKADIPMILMDRLIDSSSYSAAYMTNPEAAGMIAAREMIDRLKANGVSEEQDVEIGVMVGIGDSTMMIERLNGFNEFWDENAPKTWVVLNEKIKITDGTKDNSIALTNELIAEAPNLKGFFGADTLGADSLAQGYKALKNSSDLLLVAVDNTAPIVSLIRSGQSGVVAVATNDYIVGYESVKAAISFLDGKVLGEDEEKVIDTGVLLIDSNNLEGSIIYYKEEETPQ